MKKHIKNLNFKNLLINNFLSKKQCKKIIFELNNFNKFDDFVMGGRKRINKGSKNFTEFLKKSKYSKSFYKKLNNKKFYLEINKFFKTLPGRYFFNNTNFQYSKKIFGSQKGNKITEIKTNLKKNIVYLDLDFSISTKGYSRGPHRDRDSRLINFLIYLNKLDKIDGAKLKLFNVKNKNISYLKKRFLPQSKLKTVKTLEPQQGKIIFFESSPNSYHSVTNFYAKKIKKRYFIYGSYSLNKKVSWKTYK